MALSFEDIIAAVVAALLSISDVKLQALMSIFVDVSVVLLWGKAMFLALVAVIENARARRTPLLRFIGCFIGLIGSYSGFLVAVYVMFIVRDDPDPKKEPIRLRVQIVELALATVAVMAINGQIKAWFIALRAALHRWDLWQQQGADPPFTSTVTVTVTSSSSRLTEQVHEALADALDAVNPGPVRTSVTYNLTEYVC